MKNLGKIISLIKEDDFGIFESIITDIVIGLYGKLGQLRNEIATSTDEFPVINKDDKGRIIYIDDGKYSKIKEFDDKGRMTHFSNQDGFWFKKVYLENGGYSYRDSLGSDEIYGSDEIIDKLLESDKIRNNKNGWK